MSVAGIEPPSEVTRADGELWRVPPPPTFYRRPRPLDVGYADLLAIKPDCVAVMDAVVAGIGRTHSESGSNQEHVTGLTAHF